MAVSSAVLQPTSFHREVADFLQQEEGDLWKWFSSRKAQSDFTEAFRLALLKSTYRLTPESHPELAKATEQAKTCLGVNVPVTLYQSQESSSLNAVLYFIPEEAHIVFSGPILTLLNSAEIQSIIGHELAHYLLWEQEGGIFLTADRILHAMAAHTEAGRSHLQTARRYSLHTEVFADRGSFLVTNDLLPVVSGLVKVQTGLGHVSGQSYLQQADEIFAREQVKTEELSHPEAFIRARALRLWAEQSPILQDELVRIVHREESLEDLDLLGQRRWSDLTRRLLAQLLRPAWFQTSSTLAHAKMFFADFEPAKVQDEALLTELKKSAEAFQEYLRYLLLDFCAVDPDLDRVPCAAAMHWCRELQCESEFEKLLSKELKISARELKKLKAEGEEMLRQAEAQDE
jgi:hypothetical protein